MRSRCGFDRLQVVLGGSGVIALSLLTGCAQTPLAVGERLAQRISHKEIADQNSVGSTAQRPAKPDVMVKRTVASQSTEKSVGLHDDKAAVELPPALEGTLPSAGLALPGSSAPNVAASLDDTELDAIAESGREISLPEAIHLAFRHQPRLRAQLEGINQARGRQQIVASTFLPAIGGSYSVGGFDLGVGGMPVKVGPTSIPGFNFLPPFGTLPVGLEISSGYELAELKIQWLILDFGRRLGRFEQAKLATDVSQLQTDRAFQTVSNEVSVAYYAVLRSQAFRRTAQDANLRAEKELEDARKLEREGVVERETVLRAEVLKAETRQELHAANEAEFVALAELNLAIGLKCNEPMRVTEPPEIPPFSLSLADCLQAAISDRREFHVAQRTVQIAQEGTRVARAEFAPKIVSEGVALNLQQSSPTGFVDVALGFIRLEWNFYEGGRRVSEMKIADSRVREAMAQAESIADNIAFQVNESYRKVTTARLGIEDSRPAVDQARENFRLVQLRAREGNATATEITDAQASLTRAEQNYLSSRYAYLTALSRLEYAMGKSPTPSSLECPTP
jgi:outer membrane protein